MIVQKMETIMYWRMSRNKMDGAFGGNYRSAAQSIKGWKDFDLGYVLL